MTSLVNPDMIESIIGFPRHGSLHLAIYETVSKEVFIMHSQTCVDTTTDLRDCQFSAALDHGVTSTFPPDRAVVALAHEEDMLDWQPWYVLDEWRQT